MMRRFHRACLLFIVVLALTAKLQAVVTLIDSVSAGSSNGATVSTAEIDTTGATALVAYVTQITGTSNTPSDNAGNFWTCLTAEDNTFNISSRLCYVLNPTTSGGHSFSVSTDTSFPCIAVAAYSGVLSFDQESGASTNAAMTLQPGSLTPPANNAIVVSGFSVGDGTLVGIDGGFTVRESVTFADGEHFSCGLADLIQTTATAANPEVESSGTVITHSLATFLEGTPTPATPVRLPRWRRLE